ncbi:DNA gyrase subunit A, partial [Cyclobacteriaceae bacterium]|nr:DNA gyrase subunit A [Cyclobacteriaceae bacterium]
GRTAAGVRGIHLKEDQFVVGMVCVKKETASNLLVVSEKGYGKRSDLSDYRTTKRGGKGVKTINVTEKTGALVAIKDVVDGDELMIINKSGIAIRLPVDQLRVMGRATQGVKLIRLSEDDEISAVEKIEFVASDEIEENDGSDGPNEDTEDNSNPTNENV